jgi:hypothetical protein
MDKRILLALTLTVGVIWLMRQTASANSGNTCLRPSHPSAFDIENPLLFRGFWRSRSRVPAATLPVFGREKDGNVFSDNSFLCAAIYPLRPPVPTENAPFEVNSDNRMIGLTLYYPAEELVIKLFWRFLPLSPRGVIHRCHPDVCFDL